MRMTFFFAPIPKLDQADVSKSVLNVFLFVVLIIAIPGSLMAQSREKERDRKSDPSNQQLETRLTKAEESLVKEYMDVANEYYKQDDKESAVAALQRVALINPKMEGLKQRIDLINEELMQANGLKTEMDVAKQWVPICDVEAGKAFRLTAAGDYRFDLTTTIPLTGLSTSDPAVDHVAAAPFGALIGVVVTDGKPGEPFAVNGGLEHKPSKTGTLYLRVNVPAAARCKGDVKLQISGAIKPLTKRR